MNEKTFFEGAKICAKSHDLRAISHTQHNGNVKKGLLGGKPYLKNIYKISWISCLLGSVIENVLESLNG